MRKGSLKSMNHDDTTGTCYTWMVKERVGRESAVAQSTNHIPPHISLAPMRVFSLYTSFTGPTIREVPVSTIASHPWGDISNSRGLKRHGLIGNGETLSDQK